MFPIIDATNWPIRSIEPDGSDQNLWLEGPDAAWMFKESIVHPVSHTRQGEDWAEKIVSEIGALLGIPTAETDLAVRNGADGVLSRDAKPSPTWEQQPGDVLLEEIVEGFDSREPAGYNLQNIMSALNGVNAPPGFIGPANFNAFDVMAGYLALDALVANRDRHARNWSVVRSEDGLVWLMASYDHASSLAWSASDSYRTTQLATEPSLLAWCRRGTAVHFESGKKVPLTRLATDALTMAGEPVRTWWLERISDLTTYAIAEIVDKTPRMSEVAATFVKTIITTNRGRLLDDD